MGRFAWGPALLLALATACGGRDARSPSEASEGDAGLHGDAAVQEDAGLCHGSQSRLILQPLRIQPPSGLVYYSPQPCSWHYEWTYHPWVITVRVLVVRAGVVVADETRDCPGDSSVDVGCLEPGGYQLAAVAQLGDPDHVWMYAVGKSLLGSSFDLTECTGDPGSYLCAPVAIEVSQDGPTVVPVDLWCDEELAQLFGQTCEGR